VRHLDVISDPEPCVKAGSRRAVAYSYPGSAAGEGGMLAG